MSSLALTLLYLLAAVLGVVVCRSLKLPPMLGYLAAGVLIGPHALALTQNSEGVRHLGEFGVVLMVGGAIPGETKTASIAIYDKVQTFDTAGAGSLSVILLLISLIAIAISYGIFGRNSAGVRRA